MRGLPPPPPDVARLQQSFDINGHAVSIGFWLFNPSWDGAGAADAARALALWFTTCLPQLLELQHDHVIPTACRLDTRGLRYIEAAPPAHGAWSGGQADQVALGLAWHTGDHGRGATHISFVPGVPDIFVSDNYRLTQLAWGNLKASGEDLLRNLNEISAPDLTPCVAGTVRRQVSGVPLPVAEFSPFDYVTPTPKLVTIRRRIPSSGGIAPL